MDSWLVVVIFFGALAGYLAGWCLFCAMLAYRTRPSMNGCEIGASTVLVLVYGYLSTYLMVSVIVWLASTKALDRI